ncbi:MAG: LacI family transcriptional regulator [Firmicutes bacterium]|nr:LacI family transcriptional regulator [Bacillota bacterium]
MATLKDIAAATGLSIGTVSRVLNNSATEAGISAKTQERVLLAAQQLNYTPNKVARNLKLGRQPKAILFLYANSAQVGNDALMIHPFFSHMVQGVYTEVARMRGCYLAYMGINQRNRRQLPELLEQTVTGVITFGLMPEDTWTELGKRNLPTVSIEPYTQDDGHAVYVDNHMAITQGLQHLYQLGHRRISFISLPDGEADRGPMAERRNAFVTEAMRLGFDETCKVEYVTPAKKSTTHEIEAVRQGTHRIFAQEKRPTAILTCHDLSAIGVLEGARDIGLMVPDELSVVGIDDIDWAAHTYPPLTTVHIPKEQMGTQAVCMLRRLFRGQQCRDQVVRIPTRLIVRGSTGPA